MLKHRLLEVASEVRPSVHPVKRITAALFQRKRQQLAFDHFHPSHRRPQKELAPPNSLTNQTLPTIGYHRLATAKQHRVHRFVRVRIHSPGANKRSHFSSSFC